MRKKILLYTDVSPKIRDNKYDSLVTINTFLILHYNTKLSHENIKPYRFYG